MLVRRLFCLFALAVVTGFVAGCGGSGTSVTGTVKYSDGTPVPAGMVMFTGEKYSATGEIKADGTYEMGSLRPGDGVPAGKYQVSIGGEAVGSDYEKKPALVDKKFTDPSTSGLEVTIEEGASKEFPIVVEKPK